MARIDTNGRGTYRLQSGVPRETGFFLEKDRQFKPWRHQRLSKERLGAPDRSFSPSDSSVPEFGTIDTTPKHRKPETSRLAKLLFHRNNKVVKKRLHVSLTEAEASGEKKSCFYFQHLHRTDSKRKPTQPTGSGEKLRPGRIFRQPASSSREQSPVCSGAAEERDYSILLLKTRHLLTQLNEKKRLSQSKPHMRLHGKPHKKMDSFGENTGRLRFATFLEKVKAANVEKKEALNSEVSVRWPSPSEFSATKSPRLKLVHKATRTCSTFSPNPTSAPEEPKSDFDFGRSEHPVANYVFGSPAAVQLLSTPRIKLHLKDRDQRPPAKISSLQAILSPGFKHQSISIKSYIRPPIKTFSFQTQGSLGC